MEYEDRLNDIDVNIRVAEINEIKSKNHDNDSSSNDINYYYHNNDNNNNNHKNNDNNNDNNNNKNNNNNHNNNNDNNNYIYNNNNDYDNDRSHEKPTRRNRKLKSKKIKKIDEGRTWGVQTLDLCDGTNKNIQRNKNKMTEKNDSGILSKLFGGTDENLKSTVLPCTDLLVEIKAQGLYLLSLTRTDLHAPE